MWNELTILWHDLTIDWNDVNDLTMERNDRLPSFTVMQTSRLQMDKLKSFLQKARKVTPFVRKSIRKNHHCRLKFIVTLKIEKVYM